MTLTEFSNYYRLYGKCPEQMIKPKHVLSDKEILVRYENYLKNKNKKKIFFKGTFSDPKWQEVAAIVWKRDSGCCRLMSLLTNEERSLILSTCPLSLINTLDLAHVISRASSKNLFYEPKNIVLLSRVFHSRLDSYHDPITGGPITREENLNWWIRILGKEHYNNLLENK
jgi:hypothetical protein